MFLQSHFYTNEQALWGSAKINDKQRKGNWKAGNESKTVEKISSLEKDEMNAQPHDRSAQPSAVVVVVATLR